jgi:hypothetical protein
MENPERLIAIVKTICEENWSKVYYDLFLTDKKMVLIHKKSKLDANYGTIIGGAVGGVFGAVLGTIVKNAPDKKNRELKDVSSFDDLLSVDKKNCAILYEELKWFKVNMSPCKIVFKTEKKERTFYLMRERAEQLLVILPDIAPLNEKLVK